MMILPLLLLLWLTGICVLLLIIFDRIYVRRGTSLHEKIIVGIGILVWPLTLTILFCLFVYRNFLKGSFTRTEE